LRRVEREGVERLLLAAHAEARRQQAAAELLLSAFAWQIGLALFDRPLASGSRSCERGQQRARRV
jgi:hypothetical protein